MKTLYFDITGTLVCHYVCKPALVDGAFERAVRQARFERLVRMSNIQNTVRFLADIGRTTDTLGIIFDLCWGAFCDRTWFHRVTTLVPEPEHRVRSIDLAGDWWYLDDLAEEYLGKEGLTNLLLPNHEKRIFAPKREGNGDEVLEWLRETS